MANLENAALWLLATEQFRANREARIAVEAFGKVIQVLKNALDDTFALLQKVATAQDLQELRLLMATTAETATRIGEAWKMWPTARVLLSYAFVDRERVTSGKLQHLRFTASERSALQQKIASRFPSVNKVMAGQHAVDAGVGLVQMVLKGDHLSADVK